MKVLKCLFLITLCAILQTCAINPVTGRKDLMLMSESQEIAMGQQSDPDIIKFFGLYDDKELQNFINTKGQAMVDVSHRNKLKYEFKIVDSPVVNAFAVPGGYVYFTRGIMAHFNNEAEFAGVLGHEIGHITARHSAKQYTNNILAQAGLIAGMIFVPELQQFGDLAQSGVSLLFLKFGRDAESQADKLGVEYSTKTNHDAREMAGFFETLDRLQKQSGAEVPDFLSTHPNPAGREKNVSKLAAEWQKNANKSQLQVNRESYLRMIDGIIYGEDPRQGYVENEMFYHPELRFQFAIPRKWNVTNTPQQVQVAPSDGSAVLILQLGQGESLDAAAQALVNNYQLNVIESKRDNVNRLPAVILLADQVDEQGQSAVRTLIYLIQYGGNIYTMIGASSPKAFNSFYPTLNAAMSEFRELTDQSKLNKQPERVHIKTVNENTTLGRALKSFNVPDQRIDELSILNGMKASDKIARGTLIKVIE